MASILNDQQVLYIRQQLMGAGLNNGPLYEELLDHLCCVVETEMQKGIVFHNACEAAFAAFGKDEIKELHVAFIRSLNQKSQLMKTFFVFVLAISAMTYAVIWSWMVEDFFVPHYVYEGPEDAGSASLLSGNAIFPAFLPFDPPSIHPLKGKVEVTCTFGNRIHPINKVAQWHEGIDFKVPFGTPVLATSDGIVKQALHHKSGMGKHIIIEHDAAFRTMYAHLSVIKVKEGQKVQKGDVIGLVGSSGASTGPHLHYEVIKDGEKVDPTSYFNP